RAAAANSSSSSTQIDYDSSNYTATITPSGKLSSYADYYLVVSSGIQDHSNNSFTSITIPFKTEADTTAPTVSSSSYLSGSSEKAMPSNTTGVTLRPTIYIDFSEAVSGVAKDTVFLYRTSVIGTPGTSATAVSINDYVSPCDTLTHRATLTVKDTSTSTGDSNYPTETVNGNLLPNTKYKIVLTSSIKDYGNPSTNAMTETTIYFTTDTLPYVSLSSPTPSEKSVSVTKSSLTLKFSRTMDTATGYAEIYDLTNSSYVIPASPGTWTWSTTTNANDTVTIPIIGQFAASTEYKVYLYGGGTTFKDTYGNSILLTSSAYTPGGILTFTTGSDSTSPTVVSSFPAEGATDV
ncbi:MAG: Ig-like domain-containing protein, partial [Spirochaetota bacterium]